MSADEYPPLPVLCAPRIPKAGDDRVSGVPTKADAFPTSATHNVVLWANPFMLPCCERRRNHVGIKILAENLGFRVSALFTLSTYRHLKPRHPLPDLAKTALFSSACCNTDRLSRLTTYTQRDTRGGKHPFKRTGLPRGTLFLRGV